jgi:hypothetical protein
VRDTLQPLEQYNLGPLSLQGFKVRRRSCARASCSELHAQTVVPGAQQSGWCGATNTQLGARRPRCVVCCLHAQATGFAGGMLPKTAGGGLLDSQSASDCEITGDCDDIAAAAAIR